MPEAVPDLARAALIFIDRSPCVFRLTTRSRSAGWNSGRATGVLSTTAGSHLDTTGDAQRRDQRDPELGFAASLGSSGGPELPYPGLGAWTPGITPRFAPEGVGRVVPKNADVVVQIHYHPSGKAESDQSSIGLYFARKPVSKTMAGYTLCTDRIDIPAGEKRHKLFLSTRIKAAIHLYTVVPHAHYLCREFRLAATLPDGTVQPLLWITDWDLDWQDQYRYAQPVRLPEGTILTLAAYFDNSADNPATPTSPRAGFVTASRPRTRCVPATSSSFLTTRRATRFIARSRRLGYESWSLTASHTGYSG